MNLVVKRGSWKRAEGRDGKMDGRVSTEQGCSPLSLFCISLFIPLLDANFPVLLNYSNCLRIARLYAARCGSYSRYPRSGKLRASGSGAFEAATAPDSS